MKIRLYQTGLIVRKRKCSLIVIHKCEDHYEATLYYLEKGLQQKHIQFESFDYKGIKLKKSKGSMYKSKEIEFYSAKNKQGDQIHFYTRSGIEDFSKEKKKIKTIKKKIIKHQKELNKIEGSISKKQNSSKQTYTKSK